ncbi:MAG: antibiotic biosynthesis monooxygenase [Gammaproteobacteria bacterium]|nr:antibiotic biosynthesis monooxygenase [Gammaproteobacteria bacterium]
MIKVVIERVIAEGLEVPYEKAVSELLYVMTHARGYISSESLVDVGQTNHYVVIARWSDRDCWDEWHHSDNRKQLVSAIAPFLQIDEKFTVLRQLSYHQYSKG